MPDAIRLVDSTRDFFRVVPNNVRYRNNNRSRRPAPRRRPLHSQSEDMTMPAPYSGLPAASSVEQAILFAQLELLRRVDPARVEAAKAALLRN